MNDQFSPATRNPFVALSEIASQNNWCWKLVCTTCGHSAFRVAFSKIIHGKHPDDESFWPYGKDAPDSLKEIDSFGDFRRNASIGSQMKLASIVASAKLSEIETVVKFPDWLGYIGLAIDHCSSREARKIISDSLLPQFVLMLKDDEEICKYFEYKLNNQELLSINDLSRIETKSVNLKNPPMPLIFDVL